MSDREIVELLLENLIRLSKCLDTGIYDTNQSDTILAVSAAQEYLKRDALK